MSNRDYLNELTDEEIKELVHILGYEFNYINSMKDDTPLPVIERLPSEQKNNTALFIRCKLIPTKETETTDKILNSVLAGSKVLQNLVYLNMSMGIHSILTGKEGFLFIRKFDLVESLRDDILSITPKKTKEGEQDTQEKFAYFMADKFGKEYIKEYNKNARKHNAALEKKQEAKEQDLEV